MKNYRDYANNPLYTKKLIALAAMKQVKISIFDTIYRIST